MTTRTDVLEEKLATGRALSSEEVSGLESEGDILWLGCLADARRRAKHGDEVTFVRVHELDGARGPSGEFAAVPSGAGEVRLSVEPTSVDEAVSLAEEAISIAGAVPVTAFRLNQLVALCDGDLRRLEELLVTLRRVGVVMLAETRGHERLPEWLAVCEAGPLGVARLTVDEATSAGFAQFNEWASAVTGARPSIRSFSPLPQVVGSQPSTGFSDVRKVALARLLVDNIESIQVDWSRYGPKLAQVALTFGANDIDAVSPLDEHEQGWRRSPLEEIRRNIHATAGVPVERDGRFEKRQA